MPSINEKAIVLRVWEYSETSQIVALFTARHGRVRLLGKGLRRSTRQQFTPGLDALEYGEVGFRLPHGESELGALTEWRQAHFFPELRRDLSRLYAGLYASELTAALTEELDPHQRIFAALLALLEELDQPTVAAAALGAQVVRFQAELLRSIGYAPNLRTCGLCGRLPERGRGVWFSGAVGGLVCADCEPRQIEKYAVPPGLIDADRRDAKARLWFPMLDYYLTYIAGRRFRTAARLRAAIDPKR